MNTELGSLILNYRISSTKCPHSNNCSLPSSIMKPMVNKRPPLIITPPQNLPLSALIQTWEFGQSLFDLKTCFPFVLLPPPTKMMYFAGITIPPLIVQLPWEAPQDIPGPMAAIVAVPGNLITPHCTNSRQTFPCFASVNVCISSCIISYTCTYIILLFSRV